MRSLVLHSIVLSVCVLSLGTISSAQVLTESFESDAVGAFPASWTSLEGSAGYAYVVSATGNLGVRAVRLSSGVGVASRIKHVTSIPTGDFTYEYYVFIPDSGNVNETIGMVTVENVGMSFATGSTLADGVVFFSDHADGWTVPTNTWHKLFVEFDASANVFRVTLNDTASKKYSDTESTSYELRLEATSLTSTLQKHILYVDSITVTAATVELTPAQSFLSSPADGAANIGLTSNPPSFSWNSVSSATGYHIQISTDPTFGSGIAYDDTSLTSTSKSVPLPPLVTSTDYYWRVRAKNSVGWGDWSMVWSFRTADPPTAPTLSTPSDDSYNTSTNSIYFSWTNPSGLLTRQFMVAKDSLFAEIVVNDSATSANSYQTVYFPPLTVNTKYYWRVRAYGIAGWGAWSEVRSFRTLVPPSPPSLSSPNDQAHTTTSTQVSLSWYSVSGSEGYLVEIATDTNFTSVVLKDSTSGQYSTSYNALFPPLAYQTKYFWRISSKNIAGWGDPSVTRVFYTLMTPMVTLSTPVDQSVIATATITFNYVLQSSSVDTFRVIIVSDTNNVAGTTVLDTSRTGTSFAVNLSRFTPATAYFWRAQGRNAAGIGPWTGWWRFTPTDVLPPPAHLTPLNNQTVTTLTPFLDWDFVDGRTSYDLQVATDPAFGAGTIVFTKNTGTTTGYTVQSVDGLQAQTTYYWRVRTNNNAGSGPWSTAWSFNSPMPPGKPVVTSPVGAMDMFGSVTITWSSTPGKDSSHVIIAVDTAQVSARVLSYPAKTLSITNQTITYYDYSGVYEYDPHASTTVWLRASGGFVEITGNGPYESGTLSAYYNPGARLFCKVIDFNDVGASPASDWCEFGTVQRYPAVPAQCVPVDGATGVDFFEPEFTVPENEVDNTWYSFSLWEGTGPYDPGTVLATDNMSRSYYDDFFYIWGPRLQENTSYSYRIDAINPVGLSYGPVITFTTADPTPKIHCTGDVGEDDGGAIEAEVIASQFDHGECSGSNAQCFDGYSFWRLHYPWELTEWDHQRIAEALKETPEKTLAEARTAAAVDTNFVWEPVLDFRGIGLSRYLVTLPTRTDSGRAAKYWERFVVTAHLSSGVFFASNMDSAYSVDNLAPKPPSGGVAALVSGAVKLTWQPNTEKDLYNYKVYRSLSPSDDVRTMTPIGETVEAGFTDNTPPPVALAYYYIVATDKNGNEGEPAIIAATIVTGVEVLEGVPTEFSLGQNYPNPFNPTTTIRFGIPEQSSVTVQVVNMLGQVVEELTSGVLPAGYFQTVWNANAPSGLYIYRMVAKSAADPNRTFTSVKKMVLLR